MDQRHEPSMKQLYLLKGVPQIELAPGLPKTSGLPSVSPIDTALRETHFKMIYKAVFQPKQPKGLLMVCIKIRAPQTCRVVPRGCPYRPMLGAQPEASHAGM